MLNKVLLLPKDIYRMERGNYSGGKSKGHGGNHVKNDTFTAMSLYGINGYNSPENIVCTGHAKGHGIRS